VNVQEFASLAWKRRWLVALTVLLTVAIAAALAFLQPPRYESTATVALTPTTSEEAGFVSADSLAALLGTYAETAESGVTGNRASRILGRPLPGEVSASAEEGTGILRISAVAEDPADAAAAAGAASRAFTESIRGNGLLKPTVVDSPVADDTPIQPRPPLIIGVAALLGLCAALLLAYALETMRQRIDSDEDIAEITDAPVIGRLPQDRKLARGEARIIWNMTEAIGMQEAIRAVRTNIEFLSEESRMAIQVTSSMPGQGKSTLVANLAIALAQINLKTVVVDADLRKPQQHRIFGVDNTRGLSTLMASQRSETRPQATQYSNVWVLPSGPLPPNSTEMLHIRFGAALQRLRSSGFVLLIDSPPLLPVSDASLIAPHVDGVIMVAAAGLEKPASFRGALDKLSRADTRLLGIVLNRAGEESDEFGGYYQYGYGYGRENGAKSRAKQPAAS